MKKLIAIAAALFIFTAPAYAADFGDVPPSHWAYADIHALRDLGVTDGEGGNSFGLGKPVTRAQFAAFLTNLMRWEVNPAVSSVFADNTDTATWFFQPVEAARQAGATDVSAGAFRPNEPVTRAEMAVMLVNALGFGAMASALPPSDNAFADVAEGAGYIAVAKDFGIVSGMDASHFNPDSTATREQAAAMLMRMHRLLSNETGFMHGFYAIRSASQMNYIQYLDSVGFGWARIEYDDDGKIWLNESAGNNNEYNRPAGYEEPLTLAKNNGLALLMVAVNDRRLESGQTVTKQLVTDVAARETAIAQIAARSLEYDGVVIDFESLKGADSRAGLNAFLSELKAKLGGGALYVAVHPARRPGVEYFDGYDYRTIGEIADKVILMAHDYNAKSLTAAEMEQGVVMTPLAPIGEVYYALKAVTDPETGVKDKSKLLLQINFDTAQWKLAGGKVINEAAFRPDYDTLAARIASLRGVAEPSYDKTFESPYIRFTSAEDGAENVVWYEDARSVAAKTKLAKMFGVGGLSLWRLGNIPADIWGVTPQR